MTLEEAASNYAVAWTTLQAADQDRYDAEAALDLAKKACHEARIAEARAHDDLLNVAAQGPLE